MTTPLSQMPRIVRTVNKLPNGLRGPHQRVLNAALKRIPPRQLVGTSAYGFRLSGHSDDVIARHVYVFGVWEPDISAWAADYVKPGDIVLDIGANIGYFSLLCASLGAKVTAVEASRSVAKQLRSNVSLNDAEVQVVQAIAGRSRGSGKIYVPRGNIGDASTVRPPEPALEESVERIVLDDLVDARLRLIKVDTEGDELNVLHGLRASLARMGSGSAVLAEVSPDMLAKRGQSVQEVLELMKEFDPYWIPNDYRPTRYSSADVSAPEPLRGVPRQAMDVLFMKK